MITVFGSELHDVHKERRAAINPFFSKSSVSLLEPIIQQRIKQMCDKFSDYQRTQRAVPLRDAFVAMPIDIVIEYCESICSSSGKFYTHDLDLHRKAFGEPAGAVAGHDFSPNWEKMMGDVREPVPCAKSLPGIVQFMSWLPLSLVQKFDPLMGSFHDYINVGMSHLAAMQSSRLWEWSSCWPVCIAYPSTGP